MLIKLAFLDDCDDTFAFMHELLNVYSSKAV